MHSSIERRHRRSGFQFLAPLLSVLTIIADPSHAGAPAALAESAGESAIGLGDIAVSGFSGVKLQLDVLPRGVDPIAKTVIDPEGSTLLIIDGRSLAGPLTSQKELAPTRRQFKARDIGHVFSLAFDDTPADGTPGPGLFAGATSAFGLHIVGPDKDGDGKPDRLDKGAPGATFMEGQFGGLPGASPGSIWKIDRATGAVSLFTDLGVGGVKNSGPGLGGLAFDPASRTLYAADLDTGLIHRLSVANSGTDQEQFDYGVTARPSRGKPAVKDDGKRLDITSPEFDTAQPSTWGYTQTERRVDGLVVHAGRLYFAVAEGPEIWSVGLETNGAFKPDPRFETAIDGDGPALITGLAFDRDGRLNVAQRGEVQNPKDYSSFAAAGPTRVLRYAAEEPDDTVTPGLWRNPPEEYAVGSSKDNRASSGGIALQYGFNADALDTNSCGGTIVASADALGPQRSAQGLQLSIAGQVRPANVPPDDSAFFNWPTFDDAEARGHAGGVAVLHTCAGGNGSELPPIAADAAAGQTGFPPVAGGSSAGFPPVAGAGQGEGATQFPPVEETPNGGGGANQPLGVAKNASVATCSPKGGCAFAITVTNPNGADVPGPIVIDEQIDAPQAALTGEPNAPWTCSKTAPFVCTHPGPVPANGKLADLRLVFTPNTPPETNEVKNCASLPAAPASPTPACATIALDPNAPVQTGPIITAKKGSSACTAKGPCSFTISVQNIGDVEVKNIVIDEAIDAPTAVLAGEPNAPWTCTKTAPFSCTHPGLAAKQSVDLQLSFIPNTPAEKTELTNCAVPKKPAGAAPQQLAPQKKTESPLFGRARSVSSANFRPQKSKRPFDGLVHKIGGAGGNIGGASNSCLSAKAPPAFSVRQANGAAITFDNVTQDPAGIIKGNAGIFASKSGTFIGKFDGTIAEFVLTWSDGTRGQYIGTLDPTGKMTGMTRDLAGGPSVNFTGLQPWPCARDTLCKSYSETAKASADANIRLSCGNPPVERWSPDINHHLNWCMAQSRGADSPITTEEAARADILEACGSKIEKCRDIENTAAEKAAEFKKQNCENVPFSGGLTDPVIRQQACMLNDEATQLKVAEIQDKFLSDCKAKQAVANGGAGVPGDAGTLGNAPPAANAGPAPEQCAVVPIEPEQQPGGGNAGDPAPVDVVQGQPVDQGNGLTIQKQATVNDCSKNKSCDFSINVTGAAAGAPGPITVVDTVDAFATHDLASDAMLSATPAAPWTCAKGHPLRCTHPGPVPAEGLVLNLGMKPGANATATSMRNCAAIETAPPVAVPAPTETDTNGTKFEVIPPASCAPGASCAWQLKVTNTSAQSRTGSLIWAAALASISGNAPTPAGKVTVGPVSATPTATCLGREGNPIRQVDCNVGELTLAPNASFTATMDLQADTGAAIGPLQATMSGSFTTVEGQLSGRATAAAPATAVEEATPAPSCATIPMLPATADPAQQTPPAPTADPNGLVLTKRRAADKCSDLGGGCAFIVRITNSSQAEFNGPIEFTDVIKTADGQALPNATLESQPLLTLAEGAVAAMSCTKAGDTVTCSTGGANAKIPPGKFVDAQLTMKPGPAGGAIAVRNCALLKSGGGPSCSNISLVNGPLLRLTKFGGGDTCLPKCTFAVVIQNVGNADAKGAFKFKDTFAPASSLGGFNSSPQGGECAQNNDDLFCVPNVKVLKPGELTTVIVTVFGKAKAPEYQNCVEFVPQPQAPKDSFVVDNTNQGRCVTVKDTSPQTPNLVIRKQAPNRKEGSADGHCDLKSACRFTITVSNTGLAPFTGPLRVTDTVSLGVPQFVGIGPGSPQSMPWKCDSVQNGAGIAQSSITCELPPLPNGLAPGTTATLEVAVTPGTTWKGSDTLKNCAEITSDGEIGANAIKSDCASVILDPFNVKIAKSGDQQCPPGSDCTFKLTLFNPGPIPHNAPVTISDKLTGLSSAQIVSITPPLPCAVQPTQIPFSCTSPGNVRLDLDAKPGDKVDGVDVGPRDFTMVVRLPNDASAEQFSNCAAVATDALATPAQEVCHTVSTKPVADAAQASVLSIAKTAVSANCNETTPCNFNVTVSNATGQAIPGPIVVADLLTAGGVPLTQAKLVAPPAPWTCVASAAPGMECSHPGPLGNNASLELPIGFQPVPGSLGIASEVKNCAILKGVRPGRGTACASIPVSPTARAECQGGMVLTEAGACACPPNTKWNGKACDGSGGINTTPGTTDAPQVVTPSTPPVATCSAGMVLTAAGACACPANTKWNGKVCDGSGGFNTSAPGPEAPPLASPPPKPRPPTDEPLRVCSGDRPVGRFPNCCPQNSQFRNGSCQCLPGFELRGRICRPVERPTPQPKAEPKVCPRDRPIGEFPNCCPVGFELHRRECRRVQAPEPPQQPQPGPVSKTCPDGTKVFGKFTQCPNNRPQLPQKPQGCPANRPNGTFPNCCPRQMEFRNGSCVQDKCRQGMVGTPPNCVCPPGTRFQNDRCRVPQTPQPPPQPTKPQPAPPKPNPKAECPRGQEMTNRGCVDIIR